MRRIVHVPVASSPTPFRQRRGRIAASHPIEGKRRRTWRRVLLPCGCGSIVRARRGSSARTTPSARRWPSAPASTASGPAASRSRLRTPCPMPASSRSPSIARSMCGAVEIPVVVDCDTGYGDAVQFAHAVRQFEAAGVAAVCIEDKQFPKLNSFVDGRQELAAVENFVEKLRAGLGARRELMIVARTEALIAGCRAEEALRRARAYADAGADAVLIHSQAKTFDELASGALLWDRPTPLVAVPTTYYATPVEALESIGIRIIIYANHGLRGALAAMEQIYAEILRSGSTASVEARLWPMKTIFELQGTGQAAAEPAPVESR